jgi:hypothetical protein
MIVEGKGKREGSIVEREGGKRYGGKGRRKGGRGDWREDGMKGR